MNSHSTLLTSDWQAHYEKTGFARINGVFKKEEIDRLRCLSWKSFRSAEESQIQWRGEFPALLFWPKGLDEFRKDERLAAIARSFLGDDILQLNSQLYFRLPGDGDEFNWHQDVSFRTPKENFNRIETGYLQTAIVIDKMTRENSPIEFVRGSHTTGEMNLIPRDNSEKGLRNYTYKFSGTPMTAEPGDVLVWSVMVVHGSKRNNSHFSRQYFMNGFARADCVKVNQEFPVYMTGGKIA